MAINIVNVLLNVTLMHKEFNKGGKRGRDTHSRAGRLKIKCEVAMLERNIDRKGESEVNIQLNI